MNLDAPETAIATTKYDSLERKQQLSRAARRAYESHTEKKNKQFHLSREQSKQLIMNKLTKKNGNTSIQSNSKS